MSGMTAKTIATGPPLMQLSPIKLQRADFANSHYVDIAPPGVCAEDVQSFTYWQHVADRLKLYDEIDVIAADGSFDLQLRVTRRAPGMIDFRVLRQWQIESTEPAGELYAARWMGP